MHKAEAVLLASPMPATKRERDIRLDFFRGIAMIVILLAHITDNPWTLWLPGRFGFSDSTEIFVFCSGIASALAYGAIFHRAGWLIGTARVIYRMWQVYWVHLGIFMVALAVMLGLNASGWMARDEVGALNLYPFLKETPGNLLGLMTLTYVPNYFDVLPMYVVLLGLLPLMVGLARIDSRLAIGASVLLWVWANSGGLQLPAELWFSSGSQRPWFFNPFAWQLLFFTGFAFAAGWLPVPALRRELIALAGVAVIITIPFAWYKTIGSFEPLQDWRREFRPYYDKTGFGILRYVHFLALAYLGFAAAGAQGARLKALAALWPKRVNLICDIGRQSLAVFAVSMVLARVLGAIMHTLGTGWLVTPAINLTGVFLIWLTARIAAWFKGQGWKSRLAAPSSVLAVSAPQQSRDPAAMAADLNQKFTHSQGAKA